MYHTVISTVASRNLGEHDIMYSNEYTYSKQGQMYIESQYETYAYPVLSERD